MADKARWLGTEFSVYTKDASWNAVGGVYLFCRVRRETWEIVYAGETHSFAERLPQHERWAEAVRLGATAVHATVVQDEAARKRLEGEIIAAAEPQLNEVGVRR